MRRSDPLRDVERLIPRVYAYVAYRIGDGPDAEDLTSEVLERALRYRFTFDEDRGEPVAWLLGIARRCVADAVTGRRDLPVAEPEPADELDLSSLEDDAVRRLELRAAVAKLDERSRELLALRYGADLTGRQIADLLGERTNTVEVALHRTLQRLEAILGRPARQADEPASPAAAELPSPRL